MRFGKPEIVDIDSIHPPDDQPKTTPVEFMLYSLIPDTIGGKPPILACAPTPILVKANGEIIDGIIRWKTLKLAGESTVYIMRATK